MNDFEKKIQESLASTKKSIRENLKEAKGTNPSDMERIERTMFAIADDMYSSMSRLADDMYNMYAQHTKNHVPKVKTASAVKKFLEMTGQEGDFEVVKPAIFVSEANRTLTMDLTQDEKV
jgi:hypothetical protein